MSWDAADVCVDVGRLASVSPIDESAGWRAGAAVLAGRSRSTNRVFEGAVFAPSVVSRWTCGGSVASSRTRGERTSRGRRMRPASWASTRRTTAWRSHARAAHSAATPVAPAPRPTAAACAGGRIDLARAAAASPGGARRVEERRVARLPRPV